MSILAQLGSIAAALDLTAGSVKSTDVLNLGSAGIAGFGPGCSDVFIDVETETVAGGGTTSTYQLQLVVSDQADLSSNRIEVMGVTITGPSDVRIATAGEKILSCGLPDQVWRIMKANPTYVYCGLWLTLADGNGTATLSINAAISPSRPRTPDGVQVTRSPVNLPS